MRRAASIAGLAMSTVSVRAGAGHGGVHGEAARVAEEVEHGLAARALRHALAVLALVQEEAALLPVRQVDDEAHAVLEDLAFVRRGACLA